jgi:hypothetical protein
MLRFWNFVNAIVRQPADFWTEELDRLGDQTFFGIFILWHYSVINALGNHNDTSSVRGHEARLQNTPASERAVISSLTLPVGTNRGPLTR